MKGVDGGCGACRCGVVPAPARGRAEGVGGWGGVRGGAGGVGGGGGGVGWGRTVSGEGVGGVGGGCGGGVRTGARCEGERGWGSKGERRGGSEAVLALIRECGGRRGLRGQRGGGRAMGRRG